MKIEHIAIYYQNLEKARDFFIKYFNATSNEGYYNPEKKFRSFFLSFESGARIEIMNKPELSDNIESEHYGYAHIAFSVGCTDEVDALTERLREDGYSVISGPRTTGDGYYESCVLDTEGNIIEITV